MTDDQPPASPHDQPVLSLPPDLRPSLKAPLGPIESDTEALLDAVDGPLIAVGDVVTYHLRGADSPPDVAVVDGYTERERVDERVSDVVTDSVGPTIEVDNPPATITEELVTALLDALEREEPTTILVDGEEDLAALPAVVAAPDGASVVYGQPGEGMVHVTVTDSVRDEVRALLEAFDGDLPRFWTLLEPSPVECDERDDGTEEQ